MLSAASRLTNVRLCIDSLWLSRRDGRWAMLEDVLVDVLDAKIPAERRKGQRRANVIQLQDYLDRRRRGERRKPRE